MWSYNRRNILISLAALAGAAGCGFTPALLPDSPGTVFPGRVEVVAPTDRNSFDLVRRLEERLGQPQDVYWELGYTLATNTEGLGVTPDQTTTRFNIHGVVNYTLTDIASGAVVTSGKVENFTSYAATGTTVSTQTAKTDANKRLMFILADQLYTRLLAASYQIAP